MGDAAWLRAAVGAADAATQALGLQELVTLEPYVAGQTDAYGSPSGLAPAPEEHLAMVHREQGVLQTAQAGEIKFKAIVTFMRPLNFDPRSKLTLHDGMTGPMYEPEGGIADPSTHQPFQRTVYLRR